MTESSGITLRFLLVYMAICGLFCVVVLETAVRLMNLHEPLVWKPHPELGWEHIPGAVMHYTKEGDGLIEVNSLGYRDRERSKAKPKGAFRVAVIGDSQTEAVQVNLDETFSYVLEERLSTASQVVEVLNLGVAGYSPIQELLLLRKVIPEFNPDLIVIAVFLDNDVSGCSTELNVSKSGVPFLVEEALPEIAFDYSRSRESYDDYSKEPKHTLRRVSGVYRLLHKIKSQWSDRERAEGAADSIPERYNLYATEQSAEWASAWRIFEKAVEQITFESEKHGIPLVMASVPAGQAVNSDAWARLLARYPAMKSQTWDLDQAEIRMGQIARKLGIPLVQPYSEFRDFAEAEDQLYFGDVGHLTALGHDRFASSLQEKIRQFLPATD